VWTCSGIDQSCDPPLQLAEARHVVFIGAAHDSLDLLQLVHLILAGKDGLAHQQLSKNAAYTPHVNLCVVLLGSQKQLRRPALQPQQFIVS